MAQEVTLGGERIGSGTKQKVELHNYGMTSFNLEQDWKSSMAPGVLYPFLKLVGTNHGTFDIDLESFVRTLPTRGPLFGSFKFQLDIYCVPFRLYQGLLHNNPVNLGMNMDKVFLPKLIVSSNDGKNVNRVKGSNDYNWQINDSSLLKYLGISGIGRLANQQGGTHAQRKINAIPALAYYDIFKNYYANKQEEKAYVITPEDTPTEVDTKILRWYDLGSSNPQQEWSREIIWRDRANEILLDIYTENGENLKEEINLTALFNPSTGNTNTNTLNEMATNGYGSYTEIEENHIQFKMTIEEIEDFFNDKGGEGDTNFTLSLSVNEDAEKEQFTSDIKLREFALENIDYMRSYLLSMNFPGDEPKITRIVGTLQNKVWGINSGKDQTGLPYTALVICMDNGIPWNAFTMNGLCVKTYQSDLFNNWLNSEFIDGENGISKMSSVAVNNNSFTMDALNLAEKIYEYLNRVLVSGGTYEDWQEATYGEGAVRKAETPMYVGGMSSEVMFEEVISNSETKVDGDFQPLGSLGGKGTQVGKKGGTNIHIKCEEPSYIIGIASLTPRICYNQGNDWDMTELDTIDDLHKPALDGIGFQDLIVEQMAWWNTIITSGGDIIHRDSAGKQTAWINYQTAVDKSYGDFAKTDGYAFMVLNRNYEKGESLGSVKDVTTYIDPAKYNYAFAYDKLDAQNFWVQIHSKVIARRKMGAQQIPNL